MQNEKFQRLFEAGSRAILDGAHETDTPPVDGGPRWGMSVVVRPEPAAARRLAGLMQEAANLAGPGHWNTASRESSHFTVRALGPFRADAGPDDAETVRCAEAMRRAAVGFGPLTFRLAGVTLTQGSVMACAAEAGTGDDAPAGRYAARLAAELGPDGWYEDDFVRDLWYVNLIHFAGPVRDPAALVEWAREHRHVDLGTTTADRIDLIRWDFGGAGMIPCQLAAISLTGAASQEAVFNSAGENVATTVR